MKIDYSLAAEQLEDLVHIADIIALGAGSGCVLSLVLLLKAGGDDGHAHLIFTSPSK